MRSVKKCLQYVVAVCFVLSATQVGAEWYVAGQGGMNLPNGLTDVTDISNGPSKGFQSSDLDLAKSGVFGAKVGYFFRGLSWLGLEGDFYYSNPHLEQQNVSTSGIICAPACQNFTSSINRPGAHMRMTTAALNVMLRYPGKRFQPYIGVGPALQWARLSGVATNPTNTTFRSASDSSIGINAVAGLRFFMTKHVALFGEYKYNRASFDFGNGINFKADYSANIFVGGLSVHF